METPSLIADAIKQLQHHAEAAVSPVLQSIKVPDGAGGTVEMPLVMLRQGNGEVRAALLEDEVREGADLARQLRLQAAPGPDRRAGVAQFQALDSFATHANRFKDAGSAVWADFRHRRIVSVLDYHPQGADARARWGQHRGVYECPLSEAWKAWGGGQVLELEQDDFAALLDSRDRELVGGKLPGGKTAPDPAALISLANNLEVYSHATAKRERDPNTGRLVISYSEDKGVSGSVIPPQAFLVSIRVFEDGEPELLEVRLRVNVKDGKALFALNIHAASDVLREAFERVCGLVADGTGLPVFVGTPE